MKRIPILLLAEALILTVTSARKVSNFRLLYWNIQNGMWDGFKFNNSNEGQNNLKLWVPIVVF